MGNIGGWLEDAAGALEKASYRGPSKAVPSVEVRTQFVPYPLCGVISPWNAPMMLALLDAVPALFAGCAVLLKPSEITPRFTGPLFESVRAVPELAAVFDFVTGDAETGKAVIDNADVLCFTGSVPTGRKIAVHCAQRLDPLLPGTGRQGSGDRHRQRRPGARHHRRAARRRARQWHGVLLGGTHLCG